nr:MAG TPA: Single strand binding protein [Caudoviricetes sp.]
MSINRVCISGNLTRDPELRATASGMQVMQIGVAVNERVKGSDGQWTDRPNYVECTMFGSRAERLAGMLAKGAKVCIDGRLRWPQWQDRETGRKRSKLEVIVDDIELMQRRRDDAQGGYGCPPQAAASPHAAGYVASAPSAYGQPQRPPQAATAPLPGMQHAQAMDIYDEDIPF